MSTLQSLFLLLIVAYVGGFLVGGRGVRGLGLPSGSEWLVVGLVAGPAVLGTFTASELATFAPLVLLATGWIAMLVGLTFGTDGDRRIPAGGLLLGVAAGAIAFASVAGATWLLLEHVPAAAARFPSRSDRIALAVSMGLALADTSRHVAGWAARRLGARGPIVDRVADVTRSDDVVPIAVLSYLISADASRGVLPLPGGGAALGAVLGLACAAILGRTFRAATLWALLFGFSLLATGAAEQLDVSVMTTGFAFGLALTLASPLRGPARELASSVQGAVVLPALLLAGARASLPAGPDLWIVAGAVGARLLASLLTAALVAAVDPGVRRAGPALALAFFPNGPLGISLALAIGLRDPGPVADAVLTAAVAASLAGEFVGPPALRAALRRGGELPKPLSADGAEPAAPSGAVA